MRYGECAGHHRGLRAGHGSIGELGNLGEPPVSLFQGDRVTKGPGVPRSFLLATSPLGIPPTTEAGKVSGMRATSEAPRDGEVAVVAVHSTGEGGEGRPKRPTGGKAPSGRASAGGRQGRDIELTNPDHSIPVDCTRAVAALSEEPDASMAHVRVCGGAGWVTTGSTRQPTRNSLRSCLAAALARGSPRALGAGGARNKSEDSGEDRVYNANIAQRKGPSLIGK